MHGAQFKDKLNKLGQNCDFKKKSTHKNVNATQSDYLVVMVTRNTSTC